jgi:hypothetical protein
MTVARFIPLTPDLFRSIDLLERDLSVAPWLDDERAAAAFSIAGRGYALVDDTEHPLAVCGVFEMEPGRGLLWSLVSPRMRPRDWLRALPDVREWLRGLFESGFSRVEGHASFPGACRWFTRLGFTESSAVQLGGISHAVYSKEV